MSFITRKVFFKDGTTTTGYSGTNPSDGWLGVQPNYEEIQVQVFGTATSFTVVLEGAINDDGYSPTVEFVELVPMNQNYKELESKDITAKGIYVYKVSNCDFVRVRVKAVSGGTLYVNGRVCG